FAFVLRHQDFERGGSVLVDTGSEQAFDIGERQIAIAKSGPPQQGNGYAQKAVAFAILTFAGFEKPGEVGPAFGVGKAGEVTLQLQPGHLCLFSQASIRFAMSREMAALSCSTASSAKMSSSVGSAISVLRRAMESSATTLPRCRITICEQTRSTVSSS